MTAHPYLTVWPPLPFKPYLGRPSKTLPFPLQDTRCRIFSLARQGLFVGTKALGLEPGDEILVPAYHHGSEVEALVRAGLVCRFYEGGQRLEPDEKELVGLLGPRVRALHLIHYLGLPQDAARWRTWCDEHGVLLIEDAAQAWLSSRNGVPVGSYGDLSIFCLYKSFGLPDGAAVICTPPTDPPRSRRYTGLSRIVQKHGLYLARRGGVLAELARRLKRADESDPEHGFGLGDISGASLATTRFLLKRMAYSTTQAARAANYAFLLEYLGGLVPEPFAYLPEGASPFAFPVRTDQKEKVIDLLARKGIPQGNFWTIPHPSLPIADFPRAAALRESTIALPVHQELGTRELQRIIDAVLDALGST